MNVPKVVLRTGALLRQLHRRLWRYRRLFKSILVLFYFAFGSFVLIGMDSRLVHGILHICMGIAHLFA
jgi:hypothetical protein